MDLTLTLMDGGEGGRVDPAFESHRPPILMWAKEKESLSSFG